MIRVSRHRVIRRMTLITIGVGQRVVAIYMTRCASSCGMRPREAKIRRCVVECCRAPCRLRVTLQTLAAELSGHVIRICRPVEVRCVTVKTAVRQLVLIVRMTLIATHCLMRADKRERRIRMTERGWPPNSRCVTWDAIVIKVAENVVGIRWLCKLLRVAWIAVRVLQLVIPIDVACSATCGDVCSRQSEVGCRVVE